MSDVSPRGPMNDDQVGDRTRRSTCPAGGRPGSSDGAPSGPSDAIRVLLVEDSDADADLMEHELTRSSHVRFEVTRVRRLAEAQQRCGREHFEIVLLDLNLPDSQALDTLLQLRCCVPRVPVVVMAGDANDEVAFHALVGGAQDYCPKELILHGVLPRVIRNAIERKRTADELESYAAALEEANRSLRQLHETAESANRAKSEFLANMSHEIRTPMTAILGFADLLAGSSENPESRAAIQTIKRNGEYLLELINDILDLSKIESGRLEVKTSRCSPVELVCEVVDLMKVRASERGLPLVTEFHPPLPETICSDPMRLRQVLVNLVGNAIKFTASGGVRVVTRLVQEPNRPARLRLDVMDTGIGIGPQQMQRLFQPFTQADSTASRKYGGTGLGLSICCRLLEVLGGEIRVASKPQRGSMFTVLVPTGSLDNIPLLEEADLRRLRPRPPCPANQVQPLDLPSLDCRVLLAEDGIDNQRLIYFLLEKAGAKVSLAENGREAVEAAREAIRQGQPFDVVLMDIQMPVLDGYEATRQLRSANYPLPILALTAHVMAGERERCLSCGCDDFVPKPIDRSQLISLVAQWSQIAHDRRQMIAEAQPSADTVLPPVAHS